MNKGLEATKRLKWGYAITREERINLCECIEKELKDLNTIKKIFDDYGLEFKLTTLREAVFLLKQLQGEKSQCWDNALKKLKAFDALSKDHEKAMKELSKEIEKNRALEIVKEKCVDVQTLKRTDSVFEYNSYVAKGLGEKELSQEEYDLLKEMLL